jgi:hypothetical protein
MKVPRPKFSSRKSRRDELKAQADFARSLGPRAAAVPGGDPTRIFSLGEGDDLLRRAFKHYHLNPAGLYNWRTLLELLAWDQFGPGRARRGGGRPKGIDRQELRRAADALEKQMQKKLGKQRRIPNTRLAPELARDPRFWGRDMEAKAGVEWIRKLLSEVRPAKT